MKRVLHGRRPPRVGRTGQKRRLVAVLLVRNASLGRTEQRFSGRPADTNEKGGRHSATALWFGCTPGDESLLLQQHHLLGFCKRSGSQPVEVHTAGNRAAGTVPVSYTHLRAHE